MKKRPEQKNANAAEETDAALLKTYHRLPIARQRAYFEEMVSEGRALDRVIRFEEILGDPTVLEEAERLARGAGLHLRDLAQAVNPFQYSSYFARSKRCTMVRLLAGPASREGAAEVDVYLKVHKAIEFRHTMIPADFHLHVLAGRLEITRQGTITPLECGCVATVAAGKETLLRAGPGTRFVYVDHPLSAWVREQARVKA